MRFAAGFLGLLGVVLALSSAAQAAPTAFATYGQPALEAINQSYLDKRWLMHNTELRRPAIGRRQVGGCPTGGRHPP